MKRSSAARDSMRRADRCGIGSKPSWRTMRAAASRALSSSLARYGMEMVVPGGMRSASARNAGRAVAPTSSEYLLMKAAAWAGARADITRPRARCWRWACCCGPVRRRPAGSRWWCPPRVPPGRSAWVCPSHPGAPAPRPCVRRTLPPASAAWRRRRARWPPSAS
ncbi:hypothetical protein G6F31_017215 [Rhizopus arrhizus]|nr:hypothetical protein G6F31_017215 [Rhizopus arrhizus]